MVVKRNPGESQDSDNAIEFCQGLRLKSLRNNSIAKNDQEQECMSLFWVNIQSQTMEICTRKDYEFAYLVLLQTVIYVGSNDNQW